MKHDLLFIQDEDIIRTKFFSTSYEVWDSFFLHYEITPDAPGFSIQLDYFEDPALLIDYSDKSVTAFVVPDLGTIILIKFIARRYREYNFNLFIQEDGRRRYYEDLNTFIDMLMAPMVPSIMKRQLTLFN